MPRPYTLADWSTATATAEKYRELAAHAEKLGLEGEPERLHQNADEYDGEAELIFTDLVTRGIEP
jgi:hypothetical protein